MIGFHAARVGGSVSGVFRLTGISSGATVGSADVEFIPIELVDKDLPPEVIGILTVAIC